ncbi:MAG: glycosyltransferase family 39 protein, partial [Chloroflexota bacterium]|nr:glycosyltransferase family 39 protein [Chloroflexota bacterium]
MTTPHAGRNRASRAEWLTIAEVAEIVRVPEEAVRRRIASGTIPPARLLEFDGEVRIHRSLVYPDRPRPQRTAPTPPALSEPSGKSAPVRHKRAVESTPAAEPEARTRPLTGLSTKQLVAAIASAGILLWVMLDRIGANPAGFFCDEAEIGLSTMQLIEDDLPGFRPALFYQHFDYHHLGALTLYAAAPVLAIGGLSNETVRLAAAIWSVLAIVMLVLTVRRLGWRHGEIAVVAFGLTPVFIHIGRIQFGHAPSLFCTAAGYYAYVRARQDRSWQWAAGSGLLFGASMYGQAAWYIAAPLLVGGLILGELIVNRLAWRQYRQPALVVAGFALTCLPIAYRALTDDKFMKRFEEKDRETPPVPFSERIGEILGRYDKYFDLDYLFRVGETGMPGGWNMRHSVPGAGELTWILLPLMIAGVIGLFRAKDKTSRVVGIGALLALILYPLPDVITTTEGAPPYTFSTFSMMIGVPLLAALGLHWLASLFGSWRIWGRLVADWVLPVAVLVVVLAGAIRIHNGPYEDYPNVSSEYYGWQYGAEPAVQAFRDNPGYDRYVLDGDFNGAYIFLDFYLKEDPELRRKSIVSWPDRTDGRLNELYVVRAERYNR